MRKTSVLLLGCLLVSSSALWGQGLSRQGEDRDFAASPRQMPAAKPGERAFFSLDGEWVPSGLRELKFEIRVQGKAVVTEALQVPMNSAGGTFELLAGDPESLRRVLGRAKADRQARISVLADGRPLRTFTLSEFLDYNKRFHGSPPRVTQPLATERTFAPGTAPLSPSGTDSASQTKGWDPACLANCDANRDYCYQTEPSCYDVDYCDVCENQRAQCQNYCWICEDPKSVTERTSSWVKNAYWYRSTCLNDYVEGAYWYDLYHLVIQNDRIRRTEYCDGSVVETVLYSWDTTGDCMRRSFSYCSFANGFASGPYCPF